MSKYSLDKLPLDVLKEVSQKVKALRKQQKISQKELSKKTGVSYASIKRFEQTGLISFESLLKITDVLGRLTDFETILNPLENQNEIERLFSDKTRE